MTFYFGLNVDYDLSEISDKRIALKSLGLDLDDLDVIRGAANQGVTQDDLITLSGLNFDAKRRMFGIDAVLNNYERLFQAYPTNLDDRYPANININNQYVTKALKYDYFNYDLKRVTTADVSTSRISSWSSFNDSNAYAPIFYGGDVEVRPQNNNKSKIIASRLKLTKEPVPLRYASEVPTNVMKIEINGEIKEVFVMKGIPLKLEASLSRITSDNLNHVVEITDPDYDPKPVWTVRNVDNNALYEFENLDAIDGINFQDFVFRERLIEFYYNPIKILQLTAKRLGLKSFPKSNLGALTYLDLSANDLREIPDLKFISPVALRIANMAFNDINRTSLTAQQQISRISTSIEELYIEDTFEDDNIDSGYLDFSALTNLKILDFAAGKRMIDGGRYTPKVNTSSIEEYFVNAHQFLRLDSSLFTAPNLKKINISDNSMGYHEPYLNSTVIEEYSSGGNNHKIIDLSNRTSLKSYSHGGVAFSAPNNAPMPWLNMDTNRPVSGCTALTKWEMASTNIKGTLSTVLRNLPSLKEVNLATTEISGIMADGTFNGSALVDNFELGSAFLGSANEDNFFGSTVLDALQSLRRISITGDLTSEEYRELDVSNSIIARSLIKSPRIKGRLPNLSFNDELFDLAIRQTKINGSLPTFENNPLIGLIDLSANEISGYMPSFDLNQLTSLNLSDNYIVSDDDNEWPVWRLPRCTFIDVSFNSLEGGVPSFTNVPVVSFLDMSNNSLSVFSRGTLNANYKLKTLNLSNNNFGQTSLENILNDLLNNYQGFNRTRVKVNLTGNNFTLQDIVNDPVKANAYNLLTKVGKWSITV